MQADLYCCRGTRSGKSEESNDDDKNEDDDDDDDLLEHRHTVSDFESDWFFWKWSRKIGNFLCFLWRTYFIKRRMFIKSQNSPWICFFLSLLEHQLKMICIYLNKGLLKIFKSTMNGTNNKAQSLKILVWSVYLKVRRHTKPNSNIIFCEISILILMNTNSVQY